MALVIASAALLAFAGVSSARIIRPEIGSFGPDGSDATTFPGIRTLGFDQQNHRLYAYDQDISGIFGFDASTLPPLSVLSPFDPLDVTQASEASGLAIDNTNFASSGNVYYVNGLYGPARRIYGFSSSGAALEGNFPIDPMLNPGPNGQAAGDICDPAVDSNGNIWVANYGLGRVLEYSASGVFQKSFSTLGQGIYPCAIAFDSNDDMYVGSGSFPVWRYTAASDYSAATEILAESGVEAIAVDQGTHHVFFANDPKGKVLEYDGSGNFVGEIASGATQRFAGVAIDETNDRLYVSDRELGKIRLFGSEVTLPDVAVKPPLSLSNTGATLLGSVNPQGVSLSDCHFEYVAEAAFRVSGFNDLSTGGSMPCSPSFDSIPSAAADNQVSATVGGLSRSTVYHFRLSAANQNGAAIPADTTFVTSGPPLVETVGSPIRTARTVRLDARVDPRGAAATFHFEYGSDGPCDANPCLSTEADSLSAGEETRFVSETVEDLQSGTTYHYRVVADNGNPDGTTFGGDVTVTTRVSDDPLAHGRFPGPTGSDRAWEQVNLPDTGGNPVVGAEAISDDGNRAFYRVAGGNPISQTGTIFTPLFAERSSSGWRTEDLFPQRDELVANSWLAPAGRSDLGRQAVVNFNNVTSAATIWRLEPGSAARKIFEPKPSEYGELMLASDDGSRVLVALKGTADPAHPVVGNAVHLYDVTSGTPHLTDILPDGSVPSCGVVRGGQFGYGETYVSRAPRWVSTDGSRVFFPSQGNSCGSGPQLYMRDLSTESTTLLSGPAVSGLTCGAGLIASTENGVFFWTQSRLSAADSEPSKCEGSVGGDVYRYDLDDSALKCVTCVVPGLGVDTQFSAQGNAEMAVSADGSRLYFNSPHSLVTGAPANSLYRINVENSDLAFVAPAGRAGFNSGSGQAITPDGKAIIFASNDPQLNAVNGQQNGATTQYYRYDDQDRSLICVSCPQGGGPPFVSVSGQLVAIPLEDEAANKTALSSDGRTFAFVTATPLLPADQNTAKPTQAPARGADVYEWRDGRLLLVTDGLTNWPEPPIVAGVSGGGRDIFFVAAAQYTPDALDGYRRLYDARIGGGFEFPAAPKPCPLEVCQGVPRGAPAEVAPGTEFHSGVARAPRKVKKPGQVKKKHQKKRHRRSHRRRNNHHGRAVR